MQIEKNIGDKMEEKIDVIDLLKNQDMDAFKWAKSFMQTYNSDPGLDLDCELMLSWFANAIMVGYNRGIKESLKLNDFNDIPITFDNAGNISAICSPGVYVQEIDYSCKN
jgi:hypothetical protein